ncbi:type II secretion system protein M [Rheinheimera sp.]|uniref:type II secretion system protein M n=1 Tax=Rheinheimera sp. TaxID=1869214 RepID=UPI00307F212F
MTKQQLLARWSALQRREQQLLMVAAVAVLVAVFYYLLWQPLHQSLNQQQLDLVRVQQQLTQVQSFPVATAQTAPAGSLTDLLSSSARKHNIQVSRMQPQNEQMQVMLNDLSFDQLLTWLHELQYQHKVSIVQLDLSKADQAGLVRVRRLVVES